MVHPEIQRDIHVAMASVGEVLLTAAPESLPPIRQWAESQGWNAVLDETMHRLRITVQEPPARRSFFSFLKRRKRCE